jgi:hypothetical protein
MYKLTKGDVFITADGITTALGKGIPYTEEVEFSGKENPLHLYNFNTAYSASLEVDSINLELLDNLCRMPPSNEKFTIEYSVPIMIQARWHKKARIRKKWLKRFGLKPDMIKMRANAVAGKYHADGGFDFESDAPECLWRADQLRNGLKIEW